MVKSDGKSTMLGQWRIALRQADDAARAGRFDEELAKNKIGGPALRRAKEVAEAWKNALDEARRGEFGRAHEQLDRAERLAGGTAQAALASARRDVEARQKAAGPKVEALYGCLA